MACKEVELCKNQVKEKGIKRMTLQAQEHPQLSEFSLDGVKNTHDVEDFFKNKIVPCLAMLKEKDFSLFNDSLLEHEE